MGQGASVVAAGRIMPPLPAPMAAKRPADAPPPATGCYLVSYTTAGKSPVSHDGTLRVETATGHLIASGDLYERAGSPAGVPPDPAAGIPILPIKSYRFYVRVIEWLETGDGLDLDFELHRLERGTVISPSGAPVTTLIWQDPRALTARLTPAVGSRAYQSRYLAGDVTDDSGAVVGTMTMGLVSSYLRKATVEIDRVPASELPLDNGMGETWRTVFDKVGWDITVLPSDSDVAEPSGESWSGAEAHAAMLARRDRSDLDAEWRFHVLAVRRIDLVIKTPQTTPEQLANGERGYMYDVDATDTDNLPREGLMVASHWCIPNEKMWGSLQGQRAGMTVTYLRTAVHELGHAMGLSHFYGDNSIMCPTDTVAMHSLQTPDTPFPTNMTWSFGADDSQRLRHWPDMVVRPGGIKWPFGEGAPVTPVPSDRLRLDVTALAAAVPLGAPVRINLSLTNISDAPVTAPPSLSLMSGVVRGQVVDVSGTARSFAALVPDASQDPFRPLDPGQQVTDSLTLLRGAQGELFPAAGDYRVEVEASWHGDTLPVIVRGEVRVTVTPAVDAFHAEAARKVLATPDALLTLALGGDHLENGIEAINAALKNPVLRPHFAYVEAKRLAQRFGNRKGDLKAAASLIDAATVMSPAEFRKAAQIIKAADDRASAAALVATLKAKAAREPVGDDVRNLLRDL